MFVLMAAPPVLRALFASFGALSSGAASLQSRTRTVRDREGTPMRKLTAAFAAILGFFCIPRTPAPAQDWPTKPIHMIVPYPAGGGTDVVARIVADHVSQIFVHP